MVNQASEACILVGLTFGWNLQAVDTMLTIACQVRWKWPQPSELVVLWDKVLNETDFIRLLWSRPSPSSGLQTLMRCENESQRVPGGFGASAFVSPPPVVKKKTHP